MAPFQIAGNRIENWHFRHAVFAMIQNYQRNK
jgi:hypothetical protein